MKTIYLYGKLRETFGDKFTFDVDTPAMAFRALCSQVKGFKQAIKDGGYILIRGPKDTGFNIDESQLQLRFGKTRELHVIPAIAGAGGKAGGIIKIVLGVALLAVGIGGAIAAGAAAGGLGASAFSLGALGSVSWGTIASVGLAASLLGVSATLTARANLKGQNYEQREANSKQSFLYNGPQNQSTEGLPKPIGYGRVRVGSSRVSSGLTTERI